MIGGAGSWVTCVLAAVLINSWHDSDSDSDGDGDGENVCPRMSLWKGGVCRIIVIIIINVIIILMGSGIVGMGYEHGDSHGLSSIQREVAMGPQTHNPNIS